MTLLERLERKGAKRILALDGGGIRGALTLGFLEKIETLLRERHSDPDLKLCDYFDLIGGTSTGSIIASGLAIGMSASDIKQMYLELGGKVFGKKRLRRWVAFFDILPLQRELEAVFGDITLGDERIKTGLCIFAKRADTGSLWVLKNHPKGKFFEHNHDILLRNAIRASAAAPSFFVPERITVEKGQEGAFVDGGVSMANNPSLQLFLQATLQGYPFHWEVGEDKLLIVSVGTGIWQRKDDVDVVINSRLWNWASQVPSMLMEDANWQNQLILQAFSKTQTPWLIDSEIDTLAEDLISPEPLLSYLRYDAWLEKDKLEELGLGKHSEKLASIRGMSNAENRFSLAEIGEKAAQRDVKPEHFPTAFDVNGATTPL